MTTPSRFTDHSLVGTVVGCFVVLVVVPLHPLSAEYTHQQEEIRLRLPNTHDITSFDMEVRNINSKTAAMLEDKNIKHSALMN